MIRRVLWILLGIAMIVAAIYNNARDRDFLDRAVSAKGVVTAVWRKWDPDDGTTYDSDHGGYKYYARIRFQTEDGQSIEFESGGSSDSNEYAIGKRVQIYHDRDNPQTLYVGSRADIWFLPIIFGIFGLSLVSINIHMILRARKTAKRIIEEQSSAVANSGTAAAGSTATSVHQPD